MSGYLEVKYPLKSNLALNPFKSWKRQWCILRPSPTCSGGTLAVYCSEVGATAGCIELPSGCVVRTAKSRSRPYAFAIFSVDDRKPRVLLAAQSLVEAQSWMEKIRALLNGEQLLGTEKLLKDSFSITVVATDLSKKIGLHEDGILTVLPNGVRVTRTQLATFIEWKYIRDVTMSSEDKTRICVVTVDSHYSGGGELKLSTPLAAEVCAAARARRTAGDKLSRSDGDLRSSGSDMEVRRSSWYSGPSDVSLDDMDLVMSKETQRIPCGQLSRCSAEGDLAPSRPRLRSCTESASSYDDSMSDRRSLLSIASGIYEEIPDLPEPRHANRESSMYCKMSNDAALVPKHSDAIDGVLKDSGTIDGVQEDSDKLGTGCDMPDGVQKASCSSGVRGAEACVRVDEPTYESVAECVYATMWRPGRRHPPPPLPPRVPFGTKLGESWNSRMNKDEENAVTRHSSLGSLPRCCSVSSSRTLPSKNKAFSVFRKRLKSDSRIATSPKSDTSKENKDMEPKKKKFDFAPTRDIFKNFKVSRKMKSLKITTCTLTKGETKSCEFLDETEHVKANRCSKSVECLEDSGEFLDEFDGDLSIEFNDDAVAALALPQEIVDLILRGREQITKIRLKEDVNESDYMPMSPIIPPAPIEHHYIVMSPKTNLV